MTAQSISLGDVGSIVFELDDLVAVVTRIADRVLLAAVGPSKHESEGPTTQNGHSTKHAPPDGADTSGAGDPNGTPTNGRPYSISRSHSDTTIRADAQLESQYEIDRTDDLARLSSLNLSAPPAILLALESKSAALGRFLSQKLEDLESPEDF